MARTLQFRLSAWRLFAVFMLTFLSFAAYFTWAVFASQDFRFARDVDEARVLFGPYQFANVGNSTTGDCAFLDDDLRFGVRWFWMMSHHLYVVLFAMFPLLYLITIHARASTATIIVLFILWLITAVPSGIGYVWIWVECTRVVVGSCFDDNAGYSQCIYKVENYADGPRKDGDGHGVFADAWYIHVIVVPIMFLLATCGMGLGGYALFTKTAENVQEIYDYRKEEDRREKFAERMRGDGSGEESVPLVESSERKFMNTFLSSEGNANTTTITPASIAERTRAREKLFKKFT